MKKLVTYIACLGFISLFSMSSLAQNVAVIDTQAAILQTQVAQDAFKALEEESEYASMVEQAKELQTERQSLIETLQKMQKHFQMKKLQVCRKIFKKRQQI